jgi:hypothetical protein
VNSFRIWSNITAALLAVLALPGGSAFAQAALLSPAGAEIERRLREDEQGYNIAERRFAIGQSLAENRKARHAFPVERGKTYFGLAHCDDMCGGIDLIVRDAAGNVLDNDEAKGADPVLLFRAETTGSIEITVAMKACDEDACEYGLGFHTLRGNAGRD